MLRFLPACTVALLLLGGCTYPTGSSSPPKREVRSSLIKAMSCNVRYGTARDGENSWPNRRELLAGTIAEASPDILGVQEALDFQLDYLAERLPHHLRLGLGRDGGQRGEHAALFIDTRRFDVEAHGDFWLSDTPEIVASVGWDAALPRICTWATLSERATGKHVQVWNVHFDHRGSKARLESANLLAQRLRVQNGPHLVLGDLNAGEQSGPLVALRAVGLRDTFRDLYPDATAVGTGHGFRGGTAGAKIDYVLASEGLVTKAAAILSDAGPDGRWPSDHHLVTATLEL